MARKLSARIFIFGLEVMKPILIPLFWIGRKANRLVFGRINLRMSKEAEEKFGREIRDNLPFLFDEYHGRLCQDETIPHPRPFDYAVVVVTLNGMSLRFIRGRGEFRVQLSPDQTPTAWEELPVVLNLIDDGFDQRDFSSFKEVQVALRPRMGRLQEALTADKYPDLQIGLQKAHDHERAIIRQWENEINRRLYPDK